MKTAELKGAALNWAVAQCEGLNPILGSSFDSDHADGLDRYPFVYLHEPMKQRSPFAAPAFYTGFNPSIVIGEIIEREKIGTWYHVVTKRWTAAIDGVWEENGATQLEAALRCYVGSKLGNEVQIPEELIK
jgi:hypothetical protein